MIRRHICISYAEAACAGGGKAGVDSVEKLHSAAEQKCALERGKSEVNSVEQRGVGAHMRHSLADNRAGAFSLHQKDVLLTAELGDKREQKDDYAHASQPVHKASPHQHTMAELFNLGQNCRTGGGKARYGLKESVGKNRDFSAEPKRQTAYEREQNPAQSRGGKACLLVQNHILLLFEFYAENADRGAYRSGNQKVQSLVLAVDKGRERADLHRYALDNQNPAEDIYNNSFIHKLTPAQNIVKVA